MGNATNPFSKFLPVLVLVWVTLLALVFANVEIQIEGANGWAASLPTWRIEHHPLLEIFWGGRPLTGYHALIFAFMAMVFHLPIFMNGSFSFKLEARILGSLIVFWIIEDFIWFIWNPAFGLGKFSPACIPWHKHWLLGMPTDYPVFMIVGSILLWFSFSKWSPGKTEAFN